MTGSELSPNEKVVLYALSTNASLSDRDIAGKFGYKVSTFTAIKNRLRRMGYYRVVRVPIFWKMGYELFGAMWGTFRKDAVNKGKKLENEIDVTLGLGENFFAAMEFDQFLTMNVSRDYDRAYKTVEDFIKHFRKKGLADSTTLYYEMLPFQGMTVYSFFDTQYLFYSAFEMGSLDGWTDNLSKKELDEMTSIKPEVIKQEFIEPTTMEMRVLYGTTMHPDWPDNKLSQSIGIARQTVARIKKNLLRRGLLKTVIIPDLKKLGYDILVFNMNHFFGGSSGDRYDLIKDVITKYPPLIMLSQGNDVMIVIPFKTFGDYMEASHSAYVRNKERGFLYRDPQVVTFSLQNVLFERDTAFYYCL